MAPNFMLDGHCFNNSSSVETAGEPKITNDACTTIPSSFFKMLHTNVADLP